MVDEQTWRACMDSEIFREFVSQELHKEAEIKAGEPERLAIEIEREADAQNEVYAALDDFEGKLRQSPELMEKFRQAKQALLEHPELMSKVDEKFIHGIMMLELDEE